MNENLKWKLIIDPEISFPEAYMNDEIISAVFLNKKEIKTSNENFNCIVVFFLY